MMVVVVVAEAGIKWKLIEIPVGQYTSCEHINTSSH